MSLPPLLNPLRPHSCVAPHRTLSVLVCPTQCPSQAPWPLPGRKSGPSHSLRPSVALHICMTSTMNAPTSAVLDSVPRPSFIPSAPRMRHADRATSTLHASSTSPGTRLLSVCPSYSFCQTPISLFASPVPAFRSYPRASLAQPPHKNVSVSQSDALQGPSSAENYQRKLDIIPVQHISDYLDDVKDYPSPVQRLTHHFVDDELVVAQTIVSDRKPEDNQAYMRAGPRRRVFYKEDARAAIVTCGGLAPGLNTIIREIVMCLNLDYGISTVFGVEHGYRGFYSHSWRTLTPASVEHAHKDAGTLLGSSRGGFDLEKIVDAIETRNISMVFIVGGDGTAMGAETIRKEVVRRRLKISICHVPKTIDRDIARLDTSFGFSTAVEEAQRAINAAAVEAASYPDCVSIVKLMGRNSGFIAAHSTLASRDVDCCLIPEVSFALNGVNGVLAYIESVLDRQGKCVVVVAEGAGMEHVGTKTDIGLHLFASVKEYFAAKERDISHKYIDPTYQVRALPPIASDNILCTLLAHVAVHAAMAGFTGFCAGPVNNHHVLIPLPLIAGKQQRLNPQGRIWQRVLSSTQQPEWALPNNASEGA